MLGFFGGVNRRFCDGISRRSALKIGALGFGFGSLTLADLLRLQAAGVNGSSTKSIINIHLGGGPSHQDMWDLKPNAPVEYRGEFNPIPTSVSGMEICEHFPLLATIADKFILVRGLVGSVDEHSPNTTQTGYRESDLRAIGGAPAIGSVISALQGFNDGVAPFVTDNLSLTAGYLGPKYKPFSPNDAQQMLQLRRITADRMQSRANLLATVDGLRREADASGQLEAADSFTQQAVDVVLSGKMADALAIDKEAPEVLEKYFGAGTNNYIRENERFLRARRLVEAGVRCVSMNWGGWDTHSDNFRTLKNMLPALDRGLHAMITDFAERDMLKDVTIAVWGEFGRTPRVNGTAGRDHWSPVAAAFLAGGGMKCGQVIGSSDRIAGEASEPVHLHQVIATLYHNMGIDPETTQLTDPQGRPRYLLERREPLSALIS